MDHMIFVHLLDMAMDYGSGALVRVTCESLLYGKSATVLATHNDIPLPYFLLPSFLPLPSFLLPSFLPSLLPSSLLPSFLHSSLLPSPSLIPSPSYPTTHPSLPRYDDKRVAGQADVIQSTGTESVSLQPVSPIYIPWDQGVCSCKTHLVLG